MLHGVVVHHGNHLLALGTGLGSLFGNPLHGFGLDASAIVVAVDGVAAALEQVLLVAIAVDGNENQPRQHLSNIAQRVGVVV